MATTTAFVPGPVAPAARPLMVASFSGVAMSTDLKIESRDLLRFAVLVDSEVALLQSAHKLAGLRVARHHVGQHQLGIGLEDIAVLLAGLCGARGLRGV